MTEARLAEILIEREPALNKKVKAYIDRLHLRIFSVPALETCLVDARRIPNEEAGEGAIKYQLDFVRLPDEIRPELIRLLAAPKEPKFYRYVKDGSARTGVELEISPEDLGGGKYDYAY